MTKLTYILIAVIIVLSIWIGYLLYRPDKVPQFVYKPLIDTVYIKGKDSIVFKEKRATGGFSVPNQGTSEVVSVDTVVFDSNIMITAKSEDMKKYPLDIQYFYDLKEKEIYRTDTVRIPVLDSVFVEKPVPWYDNFTTGAVAGIATTAGVLLLFGVGK